MRLFSSMQNKQPEVSFEFFPPKSGEMNDRLWNVIERLAPLSPRFVSVTYGAGGTTRQHTHDTVARIARETDLAAAAHLTCVGSSREEVEAIAEQYWQDGVRHIVALRGDVPGGGAYTPDAGGYAYGADLVAGLKKMHDFEISVAAYPETHPEATSSEKDLDYLKAKIDAGATRAITQYFFDTHVYLRFMDRVLAAGISVPIVPGILPVTNVGQMKRFSGMCGTTVPKWMMELFHGMDDDPQTRSLIATTVAVEQCRQLQMEGVNEFHFYTLNRAHLVRAICHMIGVRAGNKS